MKSLFLRPLLSLITSLFAGPRRPAKMAFALLLLALLLLALLPTVAFAQTAVPTNTPAPPDKPILRIETGMHTASIKSISVDAANRYLVTASYDKTVRV